MTRRVYLDHNATAPLLDEAREAILLAMRRTGGWGNPSSPHAFGHEARLGLEAARRDVALLLGAEPREIVFVSGGTEADNLAIQGTARAWTATGRPPGHLITSAVEHPAVLESCRYLETTGWRVTVLPVDGECLVGAADLRSAIAPDTALVTIMAANNETGALQPLEEIASVTREARVPLHVDAVQAAGRIPLDVKTLGADLVSISSHKIGGPAGIGALFVREGTPLKAVLMGGGQERRRRSGTESPLLAAGFAAAAAVAMTGAGSGRSRELRDRMERDLAGRVAGMRINSAKAPRLPNTSSMTFPGVQNETLVIKLDLEGFAVSTGSACSAGSARPSHVLAAMGMGDSDVASTIRVSLGPSNTPQEIDRLVEAIATAVATPMVSSASTRAGGG